MSPSPLLFRLGFTVGHALWQVALLGLVAWVGLALLRRRAPQVRYAWACGGLLAMTVAPILTFIGWGEASSLPLGVLQVEVTASGQGVVPLTARLGAVVHVVSPWLAWGWVTGFGLMGLRFAAGVLWLQVACARHLRPATAGLEERFRQLRSAFGLSEAIQLRLSPGAESPLVLGWWRPVVILPVAALLHLTPAALEAVLAHELAHLRRRDPVVNLLQSLAEALLFFHPLTWWLSREIRELREQCCDDDAVALTRDPLPLAEGLAALARLRQTPSTLPDPALAAAKGPLMSRILRILQPAHAGLPSPRALGWVFLSLLAAGSLALAQEKKAPKAKAPAPSSSPAKDATMDVEFHQMKVVKRPESLTYPPEAKEKGIQGTVIVVMHVDEAGVPTSAKAIEGPEALREASEAWAKEWRFQAPRQNGKPVPARFKLTVNYKLK